MPPCCQIHFKGLASIGEDVESNLGSLLLQVRDELLQQRDPVNLQEEQGEGKKNKMKVRFLSKSVISGRDQIEEYWHLTANGGNLPLVVQQVAQCDRVLNDFLMFR